MTNETIYNVTRQSEGHNSIVKELNAAIATATFKSTEGVQLGDLYESTSSHPWIVAHKTCAPINDTFIKTVKIKF